MLKDLKKIEIMAFLGILLAFFLSRVISLNNFPIFTDEAIYLRWAQIAKNDAAWRFISLTDGKQPFYIWLTMISMKIIKDPITAGRFVSTIAGSITIIGLALLGNVLFKKWSIGILASLLYIIFPFALVYDRMALMDGTLSAVMVWALLFQIILIKTLRLDVALILGGIIGLAALTKTSGFLALYLFPLFLIIFDWGEKDRKKRLVKWLALSLVVFIICEIMYSILRLSPFFHIIGQKDRLFTYGLSDWLKHPIEFFLGNLNGLLNWATVYPTWPLVLTILAGLFWGKEKWRERVTLFLWFLIPLVGLALFGRVIYPRFIFFMMVPLLLLASFALVKINRLFTNTWFAALFLVVIIALPLTIDYDLFTNPASAKVPISDSNQYFNDWPSGFGVKESNVFFEEKAKTEKIAVFTEGTFGLLPAGVELYLGENKNVFIEGVWPMPSKISKTMMEKAQKMPTYIIFFQNPVPPDWPVVEVLRVKKGNAERYHFVYQVILPK